MIFTIFCVLILLNNFNHFKTGSEIGPPHRKPQQLAAGAIDLKRDVARGLRNILDDLRRAKDHKMAPEARTLLALQRALGQLDPRLLPMDPLDLPTQQQLLEADNQTAMPGHPTLLEVCTEMYMGAEYDLPYHTKAFLAECQNKVPLRELVTITIDATHDSTTDLDDLLEAIVLRYESVPVTVAVASQSIGYMTKRYSNVKIVWVTTSTPAAVRWTRLLKGVTTKYVLVGRRLATFSPFSDIERLVRALRQVPFASYVTGAVRNETGQWRMECYQTRLELYGLTLREGYTNSALECMYCDAVGGPFLTTTKLITSTPLDESLPDDVVFNDWFLRVQVNDGLGLACPDVLFFVSDNQHQPWESRKPWEALASKWGVTDVHLPGHVNHHFTCADVDLRCGQIGEHFAVPPCCLAQLGRALRDVVRILESKGVKVHVTGHTVVSAVKGGLQPWEVDAHIAARNSVFLQHALTVLRKRGFVVHNTGYKGTYLVHVFTYTIVLHVVPIDLEAQLPLLQRDTPTSLYIGNAWLLSPPNPGLYARGLHGYGSLQHSQRGRSWPLCPNPNHHACLDHLPLDGSLVRLR
ncbi:uncharacterized protein [Panulirus ornatus]|uniref:uncharacterized protein n=1 Tax=Panulirus ornatus TaxID=150431 RepID=UPI003A890207